MEEYKINGRTLEYDDETHCYIVDGIVVPSVTQILQKRFNDYLNVSAEVLKRASEKGTELHEAIEMYEKTGKEVESVEFRNYKFLKSHYGWKNVANEIPIIYEENGQVLYAGRLDQIIEIDGQLGINDFKRVSAPNKDKIALQLNLYRLGYEQSYNGKIEFLAFTQLREDKRKFTRLPIAEEYTKKLLRSDFHGE